MIFALASVLLRTEPDILFSVQDHVNVVALLAKHLSRTSTETVISVHTTPRMALRADPGLKNSILMPLLMRQLYPTAGCVAAISCGAAADLQTITSIPLANIRVIYNPIVDQRMLALSREPVDHPWFSSGIPIVVSVGRLSEEKGYVHLLRAVARVLQQRSMKLVIVGDGEQRQELEDLARQLHIARDVAFLGYQENPYKYMARADVFVLSSLWEGLPTVLVEAMACGAPVVASDCPSGPREIITQDEEGILVPPADPEALAEAILKVLSDRSLRNQMRVAAVSRAQDFRADRIARQYEALFLEILRKD
jgi:glycosyltransferase involved in cell wall biosynthesis